MPAATPHALELTFTTGTLFTRGVTRIRYIDGLLKQGRPWDVAGDVMADPAQVKSVRLLTETDRAELVEELTGDYGYSWRPISPASAHEPQPPADSTLIAIACVNDGSPIAITVLDTSDMSERCRISLPEWDEFRPASAGHRLIEHGYMLAPAAYFKPGNFGGWAVLSDTTYIAPVVPRDA